MTHTRREFLQESAVLGAGAFCTPKLAGVLGSSLDGSATSGTHEFVCPKSAPPAHTLWALRIEDLKKEPAERLPLSCLQGLVNRRQPQIFLAYDRFDEQWLDWLRERGDVKEVRWARSQGSLPEVPPGHQRPGDYRSGSARQHQCGHDARRGRRLAARHSGAVPGIRPVGKWRWTCAGNGRRTSRPIGGSTPSMGRACPAGPVPITTPASSSSATTSWNSRYPWSGSRIPRMPRASPAASPAEEAQFARDLFQKLPVEYPLPGLVGPWAGRRRGVRREWPLFGPGPGQPTRQVPGVHGV